MTTTTYNWRDVVFLDVFGVANRPLSDVLAEYADENELHDIVPGGYCVCGFCQVFVPMALALERAAE